MDEIEVLNQHRPVHPPMTAAERAIAKEHLMTHIDEATRPPGSAPAPAEVDVTASPRRNRRALRRVGLVGAAAAVAAVVLAVGASDRAPEPLRDRPATAAEQLEAIADMVAPYPDTPFSVRARSVDRWEGPKGRTDTNEALVHHAAPGVLVSETDCETPCFGLIFPASEALPFAADADPAAAREGIEGLLRSRTAPDDDDEFVTQSRVNYLGGLLQHPAASPTARAEILRLLAEIPGMTATPGERSATGAEGTLFRFDRSGGYVTTFLIDPSDGYVLERGESAPAVDPHYMLEGESGEDLEEVVRLPGSPEGDYTSTTTYDRPVAGPLPAPVEALAAVVAEKAPAGIAGVVTDPAGVPVCIGEVGPMVAGQDGAGNISVPDGLAYTYCGLP
ncbi:MAG TPA: hypothetical protein VGO60_00660 [Iamia sp.]|jgi:hypothetical protein|nr:hypothetical protein [Iamia sp.]